MVNKVVYIFYIINLIFDLYTEALLVKISKTLLKNVLIACNFVYLCDVLMLETCHVKLDLLPWHYSKNVSMEHALIWQF